MYVATYNGQTGVVLNMTLKKVWFDRILKGLKKVEYREGKEYWDTRFLKDDNYKRIKFIRFANGYGRTAPAFTIECVGIKANVVSLPDSEDENYEKDFSEGCVDIETVKKAEDIEGYEIKLGRIVSRERC